MFAFVFSSTQNSVVHADWSQLKKARSVCCCFKVVIHLVLWLSQFAVDCIDCCWRGVFLRNRGCCGVHERPLVCLRCCFFASFFSVSVCCFVGLFVLSPELWLFSSLSLLVRVWRLCVCCTHKITYSKPSVERIKQRTIHTTHQRGGRHKLRYSVCQTWL